jgi:hypothetical protein
MTENAPQTPEALAQAARQESSAVAEIREQYRKYAYYTERLAEVLRDEGSGSDMYYELREIQKVFEPATQKHIGILLSALAASEARAAACEDTLTGLVDDMREVDWHYVPSDLQKAVAEVLLDTNAKTKRYREFLAREAARADDAPASAEGE